MLFNNPRGKVDLYNEKAVYLTQIGLGQSNNISESLFIKLVEFITSTGIQIKADPGINLIYIGFGFLIISSFVSYISFSEIWFLETADNILFGGQTNRAKVKFHIEMEKVKKAFPKYKI